MKLNYQHDLTEGQKQEIAQWRPLGMRVIYRRLDREERTYGGLILPRTSHTKNVFCQVISVAKGVVASNGERVPASTAQPGDIVVIRQFEDSFPLSLRIPDHFITSGLKVEAVYRRGRWPIAGKSAITKRPPSKMPDQLNKLYEGVEEYDIVEPLMDWILVYKNAQVEKTAGGIHIPEVSQDLPIIGTLMSVGPGRFYSEGLWHGTTVKAGDRVVFSPYAGYELELNGIKFHLMQEKDLFGQYTGTGSVEASDMLRDMKVLQTGS